MCVGELEESTLYKVIKIEANRLGVGCDKEKIIKQNQRRILHRPMVVHMP